MLEPVMAMIQLSVEDDADLLLRLSLSHEFNVGPDV